MYDVITIGSATRDVFIEPSKKEAYIEKDPKYKTGEGICFDLGSKIDVPDIHFKTGGSAVNAAITFANQGLSVATLCKVGKDSRGRSIVKRLKDAGAETKFIIEDKNNFTAYSIIMVASSQRTIFVHRGATEHLCCDEPVPYEDIKDATWFYITNLGGESAKIFLPIIDFAHENGIKIALNPGKAQLSLGEELKGALGKVDILILNQEEASYLTGISFKKEEEIFEKLDSWVKGFVIITKGPKGFTACDNNNNYSGGILKEPNYTDRTGAGDAFGSGVVASIIKGMPLDAALQFASANATGVLTQWGANYGLLSLDDDAHKFGNLEISKNVCSQNRH